MEKTNAAVSTASNSKEAGREVAKEALKGMEKPELLIVFASVSHNQKEVLEGIKEINEEVLIAGCSDSGEIVSEKEVVYSQRVVGMALESSDVEIKSSVGKGAKEDSFKAGKEAAEKLKAEGDNPSLIITLTEGLPENGAAIVRGAQEVFGEDTPFIGGAAGDDFAFEKTYQYYDNKVMEGAVVLIGFYGEVSFGFGVRHGWEPVGVPMKVTKAEGSLIKEVDGKPALSIYEEYFGKTAEEMIDQPLAKMVYTYPLGMTVEGKEELLIRDVIVANEKREITVAAEIPEGSEIRLMLGDREKAMKAARKATREAKEQLEGETPTATIVFDCMARNRLLGKERKKEIDAIREVVGENIPLVGFYTYGEIGPLKSGKGKSVWHNETLSLLLLGK